MHLTPTGWVSGTIRIEKGRYENERDPPPDWLISVRMLQKVPTDPGQAPADWSEIRWCTNDLKALERAQEKFGLALARSSPFTFLSRVTFSDPWPHFDAPFGKLSA